MALIARMSAMQLKGKRAVVTGAGSGIGRELVIGLVREGAEVLLVGRRQDALAETAELAGIALDGIVSADITHPQGRAAVTAAVSIWGGLDLLINNAGMVGVGPLEKLSDGDLAAMLMLNVAAPASLIRDLIPALRRGVMPRVVNVGSMFGDIAFPYFAAYSASKFALRGLSDALRRELHSDGIGVTYVAPRGTQTPAANAFAHLVKPFAMRLDSPDVVAEHILRGVRAGRRSIYPPGIERLFVLLQRLSPGRVDAALIRQAAQVTV
jgi:short-subunit dehydrogenase